MPEVSEFYSEVHALGERFYGQLSNTTTEALFRRQVGDLLRSWYDRGGKLFDNQGDGEVIEHFEEVELNVNRTDYALSVSVVRRPRGRA